MIRLPTDMLDSPPADNTYQAAVWLVARHGSLARLLERVPGAVDVNGDLDVDALGDAVRGRDAYSRAWADYRTRTWELTDDGGWDRWAAGGPSADDFDPLGAVAALGVMSSTEAARLRLLATLGTDRVEFRTSDLDGFDADGLRLIRDWCRVLTAGPTPKDLDAIEARFRAGDLGEPS